ncbi:hypothetical protein [Pedobacter sp. NJ-S-72]
MQKRNPYGSVKLIWEGSKVMENTLHFAMRKKTIYAAEIKTIQDIFEKEMVPLENETGTLVA